MRLAILLGCLLCSTLLVHGYEDNNFEDDDFAEFEQFEGDEEIPVADFDKSEAKESQNNKQSQRDEFTSDLGVEDELIIEDEDNEFEHFQDPEEFEGFNEAPAKGSEQPKITITEVPITKRSRWDAYWLEGIFCCLLVLYAMGYLAGRSKNTAIALNFLKVHKPLLDDNFTLVGEMGSDIVSYEGAPGWRREAEHVFTMWCSGRLCCEGMLLTLKLIKRQDLVHTLIGIVRPSADSLQIRVELGKEDGDPFVLCVAQKKLATKLAKEMQDLSVFCPEKRPGDKHGLPTSLAVLSESAEATAAILDSRVTQALNLYHKYVQYIHISDKFCGPKLMEETTPTQPPETERVMLVSFTLEEGSDEEVRALLCLTLYLTDKIKRLHLSKESLSKCEKRRQKVSEMWMKGAHAARQEQAAARRDEKRKQEKEKILAEDDPEKQRRWELKEQKRQAKRKTPKMKQLKVKAL